MTIDLIIKLLSFWLHLVQGKPGPSVDFNIRYRLIELVFQKEEQQYVFGILLYQTIF